MRGSSQCFLFVREGVLFQFDICYHRKEHSLPSLAILACIESTMQVKIGINVITRYIAILIH